MVFPTLIHPVPVIIRPISRTTTVMDEDAREPVQHAARPKEVTVQGQLSSSLRLVSQRGSRAGRIEGEDGYVLFRIRDLQAKFAAAGIPVPDSGELLQDGDLFTKIGFFTVATYVHRLEPMGHYPDQGGASLIKAYVRDRKPAKAGS